MKLMDILNEINNQEHPIFGKNISTRKPGGKIEKEVYTINGKQYSITKSPKTPYYLRQIGKPSYFFRSTDKNEVYKELNRIKKGLKRKKTDFEKKVALFLPIDVMLWQMAKNPTGTMSNQDLNKFFHTIDDFNRSFDPEKKLEFRKKIEFYFNNTDIIDQIINIRKNLKSQNMLNIHALRSDKHLEEYEKSNEKRLKRELRKAIAMEKERIRKQQEEEKFGQEIINFR